VVDGTFAYLVATPGLEAVRLEYTTAAQAHP
jgi:hypothetical protein